MEPEILDELGNRAGNRIEIASWNRESRLPSSVDTLRMLGGLTERLCDLAAQSGSAIRGIQYEIDPRPVPPHGQQRDVGWHMDGVALATTVVVANTMPTEFLIPGNYALDPNEAHVLSKDTIVDNLVNKNITDGIYNVYQPRPYELALMTDHVHRSPYNNSDIEISRIWLRAFLFGWSTE